MIINHNYYIKLVPLVIFIYDARSHIRQMIKQSFNKVSNIAANDLVTVNSDRKI